MAVTTDADIKNLYTPADIMTEEFQARIFAEALDIVNLVTFKHIAMAYTCKALYQYGRRIFWSENCFAFEEVAGFAFFWRTVPPSVLRYIQHLRFVGQDFLGDHGIFIPKLPKDFAQSMKNLKTVEVAWKPSGLALHKLSDNPRDHEKDRYGELYSAFSLTSALFMRRGVTGWKALDIVCATCSRQFTFLYRGEDNDRNRWNWDIPAIVAPPGNR
ncbi:MAG: hypothetical protein MMC23_007691 [Stictis urceolatum]|nr:hypothetical protein [Stictis urceolata]